MAKSKKKSKKEKKAPILTDPRMLAGQFLKSYIRERYYALRRWHAEWYLWKDGQFMKLADDTMTQITTSWAQWYAGFLDETKGVLITVNKNLVNNILLNVAAIVHINERVELNSFLAGEDRGRFLSMANGLLNLDTRKLMPHTPDFFCVVQLPYDFDPNATCPEFKRFLFEIMLGRLDYVNLIQEFSGYIFRPDLREHKFLLCFGQGSNGKGVLFDVGQALVGVENCSQVPIGRFGDKFALNSTIGKVLNLTHESSKFIEDNSENILKSYVSGDSMTLDRKFKSPISVKPTAKIMVSTNEKPRFNDKTRALWRRLLLVPFDLIVEEKDQIKDLAEQLKTELPGVLNWALDGLDRLNAQGFTEPADNARIMEEYRRDSDPARAFLLDRYEPSLNGTYVSCSDSYRAYQEWCQANGCRAMNSNTFGQHVRRIFPSIERKYVGPRGGREYVYAGLLEIL